MKKQKWGFRGMGFCSHGNATQSMKSEPLEIAARSIVSSSFSADLEVCGCNEYLARDCGGFPGLLCIHIQLNTR